MPQVPKAVTQSDVDKRIKIWHNDVKKHGRKMDLNHYLGWTWNEYAHWVLYNELPKKGE